MSLWKDIRADLNRIEDNKIKTVIGNKGFHALLTYRLSNWLWKHNVPILPLILTRFIQILYAIDIDWRAHISGGCIVLHGFGLVIGKGTEIGKNATIFHGVTLGMSWTQNRPDGFPIIGDNVLFGAGAKVLGPVQIGDNVKIGANAVVLKDVPANSIAVGISSRALPQKMRIKRII